ncbi:MAG: RNA-guided endonuclease TnpB family protein [Thermoplasmata archaeon]
MEAEQTRTLRAKMFKPNRKKKELLGRSFKAYQEALEEGVEDSIDTISDANDLVVQYDLSGYMKNTLKKHIPKVVKNGGEEVSDDNALKITNEGVKLDHQPDNYYEFYVNIPSTWQRGGYWCPIEINPNQEKFYHKLMDEEVRMGEVQVIRKDDEFYVHIVVKYEVEVRNPRECATTVGLDVGDNTLVAGCSLNGGVEPMRGEIWSGNECKKLRKEWHTVKKRLQSRGSEKIFDDIGDNIWNRMDDIIHKTTREVVEYVKQFDEPVIVLEDLKYIRENLGYSKYMNERLHSWAFRKIQEQIEYKAFDEGIPVVYVNPKNTSKECHHCGEKGVRKGDLFRCKNDDCPITEYHADLSASISIAKRGRESLLKKTEGDDLTSHGARLTVPQDSTSEATHADEDVSYAS